MPLFVGLTDVCMRPCAAATNIFIHGSEEQGQLANEVRFLWGQNQALKEQLNMGSRGKTHARIIRNRYTSSVSRPIEMDGMFPDKHLSNLINDKVAKH